MAKKPSIAFLLSGAKGDDSESDEDSESSMPEDDTEGKTAAASALLDAIDAKDPAGLAEAFSSLMELC